MNHFSKLIGTVCLLLLIEAASVWAGEIHTAAAAGDLNKVRALIEADPMLLESKDDDGNTPLHRACANKQVTVANFLLNKGANVNAKSYFYEFTPLLYASYSIPDRDSDFELIQHLIDKGSDVNTQGYNGITPLHRAAQSGNLKVARFLLEHGADPNIYDKYTGTVGPAYISGTLLQVAINYSPNEEMAMLLVESGAKLNKKDPGGNTELHLAALKGYADLTRFLIGHGSDVNVVNKYNHTALYYAAKHGYRSVADVLIAAGANKSTIVEANYGKAPQLSATLGEGEAYLWYLDYGSAVKTKEHLLIFNPPSTTESPEAGLVNGHLNPNELAGQKITIFINYQIGEEDFEKLEKRIPGAEFVLNKKPIGSNAGNLDTQSYRLADPHESFSIGSIQVHTIPAVFGGIGYLVEADGVNVFNAGLHLSDNNASNVAEYRKEIDFLKPFGPIDFAILSVHSHRYRNEAVYEHYLYLIDQLSPKAIYLTGANNPEQYTKCIEVLRARNIPVAYPEGGVAVGERFHYLREQK